MRALDRVKLFILDNWGLEPLGPEQRHDVLEIVEDRYGRGATLITSQIPVERWHEPILKTTVCVSRRRPKPLPLDRRTWLRPTSGRSATPAGFNRNRRRLQSECPADIIGIRSGGEKIGRDSAGKSTLDNRP
jgi:hypothetical protein